MKGIEKWCWREGNGQYQDGFDKKGLNPDGFAKDGRDSYGFDRAGKICIAGHTMTRSCFKEKPEKDTNKGNVLYAQIGEYVCVHLRPRVFVEERTPGEYRFREAAFKLNVLFSAGNFFITEADVNNQRLCRDLCRRQEYRNTDEYERHGGDYYSCERFPYGTEQC